MRAVAYDLRRELSDPRALCAALGLGVHPRDRVRQSRGLTVRCPRHGGVSCSVTRAPDGTVRVKCFGCDFAGDALHLIAEVHGLDTRRHCTEVLRVAADLARRADIVDELTPRARSEGRSWTPSPAAASAGYAPTGEVHTLWAACGPCSDDADVSALLESRCIRPAWVDDFQLARVIPTGANLPFWASFRGTRAHRDPWTRTGHRLLLPMYDQTGCMRSVRAWCVRPSDDPKRLPPAGHRATGLVLACGGAATLLATGRPPEAPSPLRVLVVEGEPDFLSWATRFSDADASAPLVFGVVSGAWTEGIASRIPDGTRVIVRTHHDAVGDGYAEVVRRTLHNRCTLLRPGEG
jgi:hypothetical protein